MLRILTDADLNPRVAEQVRRHRPDFFIASVFEWEGGRYSRRPDPEILEVAASAGLTLLTYDRSTIMPELRNWGIEGRSHGGVIFVDDRTIAQKDIGGLVRSVIALWDREFELDWANRIVHLARED